MSYVNHVWKEVAWLPESECLNRVEYWGTDSKVVVFYESNPDHGYEHEVDGRGEFQRLLELIEEQRSGYHGLDKWITARIEIAQRIAFNKARNFYADLSELEKTEFKRFALQAARGLY